ncbi:hypothetical protein LguiA_033720 [Lonicera macranthoides]
MAFQLPTLAGFHNSSNQKYMLVPSSESKITNIPLSRSENLPYKRARNRAICKNGGQEKERAETGKVQRGHSAQYNGRTSVWIFASSFGYMLKKVKAAFYNKFCFGVVENQMVGNEASLVDVYFSIPVVPPTTSTITYVN